MHDILSGHVVMGIPKSNEMQLDLMRQIDRKNVAANTHLRMDDWNFPTLVQKRLSRTQAGLSRTNLQYTQQTE